MVPEVQKAGHAVVKMFYTNAEQRVKKEVTTPVLCPIQYRLFA